MGPAVMGMRIGLDLFVFARSKMGGSIELLERGASEIRFLSRNVAHFGPPDVMLVLSRTYGGHANYDRWFSRLGSNALSSMYTEVHVDNTQQQQ